jgi:hypothetical protein
MIALVQVKMVVEGMLGVFGSSVVFTLASVMVLVVRRAMGDEKGGW